MLAYAPFVLRTGIQRCEVPAELGCCDKACWRRPGKWHATEVWTELHRVLPERLHIAGELH